MLTILLATAVLGAPTSVQDTLIQVREGDQLVLRDFSGAVEVEGWNRNELRAEADDEETLLFRFSRSGSRIEMGVRDRKDRNRMEELRLFVPSWMDLEVSGRELDIEVGGIGGKVLIRNLEGDIILHDLSGEMEVSTVEGSIDARNLRGTASLKTGDDDITVLESSADLELESVEGDIELIRSNTRKIDARTTEGDVEFTGRLLSEGVYAFHSHGGELTLNLEPPVDADVTVLVYEGEFQSDFPIRAEGYRSGQDLRFVIGEGGAQVLLDAFDGEVRLRRAGSGGGEAEGAGRPPSFLRHPGTR
jgi:hypothetical protein